MKFPRASGILLHPTALPGPHGIGALGREAKDFVDFLAAAGQSLWQILPMGPTGFGDSPYNALSAFAGNPLLIDLSTLADWGDLDLDDLAGAPEGGERVDFPAVHRFKNDCLGRAAARFFSRGTDERHLAFSRFCHEQSAWLDDYALFSALREHFAGQAWYDWPEPLRRRDPAALAEWRHRLAPAIAAEQYRQHAFCRQWHSLREYARKRGIRLFGDLPIFVALDSADVWSRQELFRLDPTGRPMVVAGVPPDYFSADGQRWGNPLYRWEAHRAEHFSWWLARFRAELERADLVRIDHFRGFDACWAIPATEPTAAGGSWEPAPGRELFEALRATLPELPIVAEDLGIITTDVEALRREFGFPGMKILQFAFDSDAGNPYLPHNHEHDTVVYTGTHDNATTLGWWTSLDPGQRRRIGDYLGKEAPEIPWDLVRLAMGSVADTCIIPCQDVLELDDATRFNNPGRAQGNWHWRADGGRFTTELAERLRTLTAVYGRLPRKNLSEPADSTCRTL